MKIIDRIMKKESYKIMLTPSRGIMVGWSRFSRSLIIYLLVGLIAVQFFKNASKLLMHDRLQILLTSQDLNRPKIDSAPSKTK